MNREIAAHVSAFTLAQIVRTCRYSRVGKLAEYAVDAQSEELQVLGLGITLVGESQAPLLIAEGKDVHE